MRECVFEEQQQGTGKYGSRLLLHHPFSMSELFRKQVAFFTKAAGEAPLFYRNKNKAVRFCIMGGVKPGYDSQYFRMYSIKYGITEKAIRLKCVFKVILKPLSYSNLCTFLMP